MKIANYAIQAVIQEEKKLISFPQYFYLIVFVLKEKIIFLIQLLFETYSTSQPEQTSTKNTEGSSRSRIMLRLFAFIVRTLKCCHWI